MMDWNWPSIFFTDEERDKEWKERFLTCNYSFYNLGEEESRTRSSLLWIVHTLSKCLESI